MRFRALLLLAALVVAVLPAIAWGGPTMTTSAGHSNTALSTPTGYQDDGDGTVGGQA